MRDRWFKSGLTAICLALSVPVFATSYVIFPDAEQQNTCTLEDALASINTRAEEGVGECKEATGNDKILLLPRDETYYNTYKTGSFIDSDDKQLVTEWIKTFSDYNAYQQAVVYTIDEQLEIGGDVNADGDAVNASVSLEIFRNVFDKVMYGNAVIKTTATDQRLVFVHRGSNLTVKNITLDADGSDISGNTDSVVEQFYLDSNGDIKEDLDFGLTGPNGGVIYTKGNLFLEEGTLVANGLAKNGGGVYIEGGKNSLMLSINLSRIDNNHATENGGAIGMPGLVSVDPNDSTILGGAKITLVAGQFNLFGNAADQFGGAAYLDGAHVDLGMVSGTFYANEAQQDGSAIYLAAGDKAGSTRTSKLNNITVFGNQGNSALYYAGLWQAELCTSSSTDNSDPSNPVITCDTKGALGEPGARDDTDPMIWVADKSKRVDQLFNSVVIDDVASCGNVGSSDDYLHVAYSATDANCALPDALETQDINKAQLVSNDMLVGKDRSNDCGVAAACEPAEFGRPYYYLKGFYPNENATNKLVNFASPDTETAGLVCHATDGRNINREDACDIGAIEMRIAKGAADRINGVETGKTVWIDVLKNDLGDTSVSCPDISCLTFSLLPQYGGQVEVVLVSGPLDNEADGTPVYMTMDANDPIVTTAGTGNYPLVKYTSAKRFHGQDQFLYQLDDAVITGSTYAGFPLSAQVNLAVAPKDDFKSADIGDFKSGGTKGNPIKNVTGGGLGGVFLMLLSMLGLAREKFSKKSLLVFAGLLLGGVSAAQADIKVNAHDDLIGDIYKGKVVTSAAIDPGVPGDGLCSLAEAIQRGFDDYPIANNDCAAGAPGTDTIVLPEGTITLRQNIVIPLNNSLIIKGQGVNKSVIDGNGSFSISASSPLSLRYLTFRNGSATNGGAIFTNTSLILDRVAMLGNQASDNGGAIYLNYAGNIKRALTISRSYFKGNKAGIDGGVVYTVGQTMKVGIEIDNSTFDQNEATGKGGVVAANLAQGSNLNAINSIFNKNVAARGSVFDFVHAHKDVKVALLNNTFYENSGSSFIDSGSNKIVTLSHSIIAASNAAAIVCSSTDSAILKGDHYNLYAPSEDASCGASDTAMEASFNDVETVMNGGVLTADLELDDGEPVGFLDVDEFSAADNYVPPVFELLSPNDMPSFPEDMGSDPSNPEVTPIIIDRGNKANLASGTSSEAACRATDIRGKSRKAIVVEGWEEGDATCDIGAYEVQLMTALDESTSVQVTSNNNQLLEKRIARANVLVNDLPSDNADIIYNKIGFAGANGKILNLDANTTSLPLSLLWDIENGNTLPGSEGPLGALQCDTDTDEPQKSTCRFADDLVNSNTNSHNEVAIKPITKGAKGKLRWVEMEDGDPDCVGDKCGLLFEMTKTDVEAALGEGNYNLVCPDSSEGSISIPYVVYDDKEHIDTAVYSAGLRNIPPQFTQKGKRVAVVEVSGRPDKTISIPLEIVDVDGHLWNPNQTAAEWQGFYSHMAANQPESDDWEAITMSKGGDPQFAVEDDQLAKDKANSTDPTSIHPAWGYGVKWNGSLTNPMITYTRANKTQFFTDRFKLDVRDNCGGVSTLTIVVKFPNSADEGGNGLIAGGKTGIFGSINVGGSGSGAGGFGLGFLLALFGLGALRYRKLLTSNK